MYGTVHEKMYRAKPVELYPDTGCTLRVSDSGTVGIQWQKFVILEPCTKVPDLFKLKSLPLDIQPYNEIAAAIQPYSRNHILSKFLKNKAGEKVKYQVSSPF